MRFHQGSVDCYQRVADLCVCRRSGSSGNRNIVGVARESRAVTPDNDDTVDESAAFSHVQGNIGLRKTIVKAEDIIPAGSRKSRPAFLAVGTYGENRGTAGLTVCLDDNRKLPVFGARLSVGSVSEDASRVC